MRFRYLVFFDDGYAQYVNHNMVYLIFESSKDVWDDIYVENRAFIKKYLQSYPARSMVKLNKNQTVRTEHNGMYLLVFFFLTNAYTTFGYYFFICAINTQNNNNYYYYEIK